MNQESMNEWVNFHGWGQGNELPSVFQGYVVSLTCFFKNFIMLYNTRHANFHMIFKTQNITHSIQSTNCMGINNMQPSCQLAKFQGCTFRMLGDTMCSKMTD